MNAPEHKESGWSRRRWVWTFGLLVTIHLAAIMGLGRWTTEPPRIPARIPPISAILDHVISGSATGDPTLFVRPNHNGFSGEAWLRNHDISFAAPDSTEPPFLLPFPAEDVGRRFAACVATNARGLFDLVARPVLRIDSPVLIRATPAGIGASRLRVEGGLAQRPLRSRLELPRWRSETILASTVIQLTVDGLGRTLSAHMVESSGLAEADERALELARSARFEPAGDEGPDRRVEPFAGMSSGRMVFLWQTLPVEKDQTAPVVLP